MTKPILHPSLEAVEPSERHLAQSSPGAALAAHRQAQGWSIEEVALKLNFAPRQIQALETDNFAQLPGMAVARGFMRAYAKLLKMDAGPLLAMLGPATSSPFNESKPVRQVLSEPFISKRHFPLMGKGRSVVSKPVLALFSLILLAVGAFVIFPRIGMQTMPLALPAKGVDLAPVVPKAAAVVHSLPQIEVAHTQNEGQAEAVASASAFVATPPLSAAPAAPPAMTLTAGGHALVLIARENSWMEVRGSKGKGLLAAKLLKAGTTETFDIDGPLSLTLGNAPGVDILWHGVPVAMNHQGSHVAHLNLK